MRRKLRNRTASPRGYLRFIKTGGCHVMSGGCHVMSPHSLGVVDMDHWDAILEWLQDGNVYKASRYLRGHVRIRK